MMQIMVDAVKDEGIAMLRFPVEVYSYEWSPDRDTSNPTTHHTYMGLGKNAAPILNSQTKKTSQNVKFTCDRKSEIVHFSYSD